MADAPVGGDRACDRATSFTWRACHREVNSSSPPPPAPPLTNWWTLSGSPTMPTPAVVTPGLTGRGRRPALIWAAPVRPPTALAASSCWSWSRP